jgi:ABC-type cobalamin/Fe3+-siderophores transport system ATPase subunit
MIEVSNLNAFYGKRQILSNINLSVKSGECHFIVGPNGSGKSTLLSLISRTNSRKLINTGTINLNGNSIHKTVEKIWGTISMSGSPCNMRHRRASEAILLFP